MNAGLGVVATRSDHWSTLGDAPQGRSRRPLARERQRLRLYFLLICFDAAAIASGYSLGNLLRFGSPMGDPQAPSMAFVMMPLYLAAALTNGSYSPRALTNPRYGCWQALLALAGAATAVIFLGFILKAGASFSRLAFSYGSGMAALTLVIGRLAFDRLLVRGRRAAMFAHVLIVDGEAAPSIPHAIVVNAETMDLRPDIADPHSLDRLGHFVQGADRVIVACPPERRADWAMALKGAHVHGEIVARDIASLGVLGTSTYGREATLVVATGALGLRQRAMKRLLDLFLGIAALLVLAPLMLLVALAVKLEDGGPVLFAQSRLGRGNRLFRMYKFRSMRAEQCDAQGNRSTGRDDDRVTRIGRLIRRTSIDELPQLLNILRGDMSFVGPRPHALGSLAGDQLFWEIDQRYWHRHNAKPGLTGLAQVRGYRGATLQRADLVNRLQADLEYISGWTLGRDIMILLATVRVIIHRNAY